MDSPRTHLGSWRRNFEIPRIATKFFHEFGDISKVHLPYLLSAKISKPFFCGRIESSNFLRRELSWTRHEHGTKIPVEKFFRVGPQKIAQKLLKKSPLKSPKNDVIRLEFGTFKNHTKKMDLTHNETESKS